MSNLPSVSIPSTEVQTIHSYEVNQDYLISVALPFHYDKNPERRYPVIYLLDANLYFGMVVEMVRTMNIRVPFCNELPDAIIVGISYPASGTLAEIYSLVMHLRMRDFLPEVDDGAENFIQETFPIPTHIDSGGASRFLQFITNELIPMVETEYRTDPTDRTLIGHSWGGLFAFYSLFHQPELFQRYVVVSPDLTFHYEQSYAEQHKDLPVRLFLAFGEPELDHQSRTSYETFIRVLESRCYAGFTLTHQIIPNCTHCAVVSPAFQSGLMAVFSGWNHAT